MIAVFDDFVKDPDLLDAVAQNEELWSRTGDYKYWKGWWVSDPKNTAQRLIQYIWGYNFPLKLSYEISGFEYWTGIQSAEIDGRRNYLEMHYDDDVKYREITGDRMFPILGCVYYPIGSEFTGGDLAIYTEGESKTPEIIKSLPNRLVIFNPDKYAHCVQEVTSGTRRAIAINIWDQDPWSVQAGYIKIE